MSATMKRRVVRFIISNASRSCRLILADMNFEIRVDNLSGPEIAAMLADHLREMHQHSPPESVRALNLEALKRPEITFWSAWSAGVLVGCCALKDLGDGHGEIKSM